MHLFLPFKVRHSGTCGTSCDCTDSCPVYTETQELDALTIALIGTKGDNEWVESIHQNGKAYSQQDILTALKRNVDFAIARHEKLRTFQ
ncbi:hypothetical protein JCM19235_1346 [Vibrio maritimus]|uniref:Uncharacterized protein n=1 Tax=Vibrio maritimus TaxID=990268 RepID=A0A090S5R7_9VIBR|nr:hypothetical protein JCM19235_1346 [Vibrio maritimus]